MLNFRIVHILQRAVRLACPIRIMSKKCKLDTIASGSTGFSTGKEINSISSISDKGENELNYEYMPMPEKSPADKKEYSVIRLKNGLTALLITDHPVVELTGKHQDESSCSESEAESDNEIESVSSSEGNGRTENEEKIAACALCVGVGSFSDPEDIPGLAHFLEHMVFMGSNKYPAENEFDSFIKRKGGSDNASTECEHTTYYFECQEEYLHDAMDIFSQFFISPLMKYDAMARERQAIESEYRMALPSDSYRKDQLISSLAARENPAGKFMWGNLETLKENVTDDKLYKSVHEFRKRHYSAHRMMLAVQARLSQETLASWVHDCFSKVESNEMPPLEYPRLEEPFSPELFNRLYYVEPVNDICEVELTWHLPPTLALYKTKPLEYVSWLLGYEGAGGLLSYLKRKVWALGIEAGEGDDAGCNSLYSTFSVKVQLSEEGYNHIEEILNATFSYIKLLQDNTPSQRIYDEMKAISDMNWRYREETSPVENVESLVENMHLYPPEHYLTGSDLHFEFNSEEIKKFIDLLIPQKVNVMISSKRVSEQYTLDQTEKWFGTKYTSRSIPDAWLQAWVQPQEISSFYLPHPNPFIPTDLSILPVDDMYKTEKYPRKIWSKDSMELWFKEDVKFNLPQAHMYFYMVSPQHASGPLERAMVDVYAAALGQLLAEDTYPAVLAEMGYTISCSDRGLTMSVQGFSQNLHLLVDKIITGILNFNQNLSNEMFEAVKRLQRRYYTNHNLKAGMLATELRMMTTLDVYWPLVDRLRALDNVTYSGLLQMSKDYYTNMYVYGLMQGNISVNRAKEIAENMSTRLVETGLEESLRPHGRVCRLDEGQTCIRARSFNPEDVNCVTTLYFQDGPGSLRKYCILEILLMLLEEPLFDTLRTREQLGYDVSCSVRDTYGILGFSLTVISQRDKVSVDHVQERMEAFLLTCQQQIQSLSTEEFQEAVTAVVKLKQYSDVHLKEEVTRNWSEIKNQEYLFDRLEREVELLRTITLDEIHEFLQKQLDSTCRKLVVQVVSEPNVKSNLVNKKIDLLPYSPQHITDISVYKQNRHIYPVTKIDH